MKPQTLKLSLLLLPLSLLVACGPDRSAPAVAPVDSEPVVEVDNPAEPEPFLWLEEVEGERALAWAAEQNALSVPRLQGDPRFAAVRDEIAAVLTSDDRIPAPGLVNGEVYNFWQDAEHVRGILRRTSLNSYASSNPQWETVLDIDALANLENANWVYKGRSCLPSDPSRCLIRLSDGGKDAVTIREFDVVEKQFVDGGFVIAEAKTNVDWLGPNTLVVGSDFGPGSLTESGYARTLRMWRRGTGLDEAEQIIEVEPTDVSVDINTVTTAHTQHSIVTRSPDFFTEENWLLRADGVLGKLPLPADADFRGVLGDRALVLLRSDWMPDSGLVYRAGSLISMDLLKSVAAGAPQELHTLVNPFADNSLDAIRSVAVTTASVYISALKDVNGILLRARPAAVGWDVTPIALPANGALSLVTADDYSDTVIVNYESFLIPDTLYLVEGNAEPRVIKTQTPHFDASGLMTEQKFARSADGTRIPYFVVRPVNAPMDGSTATELTAYGGFEVSETPAYIGSLDQAWLMRGGAYVLANIRGGGEYGPNWHQSAILENRQRVFDDFIAVAEDLIASGLTSSAHLGIRGGSNGGLLVTSVMVQRPELYGAVISAVPLIDMLRYHRLSAGASWMAEYGNPDIPEQRDYIARYSPLQNLSATADYPEIFLWTNPKDDRVHPSHARRMAARMLEQGHPVLYFENQEGGHGGGANLNQQAVTNAMQVIYLMQKLMD